MLAITIHNFPEGMAVGVGYAGADIGVATLGFIAGFTVMMAMDNAFG